MVSLKDARGAVEMVKEMGRVGGFAPGNYISVCNECERPFMGDKRAIDCLPCAVDLLKKAASAARKAEEPAPATSAGQDG